MKNVRLACAVVLLGVAPLSACTMTSSSSHAASSGSSESSSGPEASGTASGGQSTGTSSPTPVALGDNVVPRVPHTKAPQDGKPCTDASKLYASQGTLYMCTTPPGLPGRVFESVVKCSDETGADRPNVGSKARKENRTAAPKNATTYSDLPKDSLRYEAGFVQMKDFHMVASGTYIYPKGQKPDTHKAVPIPTFVAPSADPHGPTTVFTRVCFDT